MNRRGFLSGLAAIFAVAPAVKVGFDEVDFDNKVHQASRVMFENNDYITRKAFRDFMNEFLQKSKNSGDIYDYKVVCDESNNTPDLIDRNQLAAEIYVKHSRSISFRYFSFRAEGTTINMDDVIGSNIH